jgi:uncharacterized membrane protein YoaK (UPF0700 family)
MSRHKCAVEQRPHHEFDWLLVAALSMTAGAVDVIGFLALGGLFIAHITGNIVVLVAHYTTGSSSWIGPLIAVPVFITVLGAVIGASKDKPKQQTLRALLILHAGLLTSFLTLSTALGSVRNPESTGAACVAMLGVAAMATQNALVKLDLPGFPTTAVLTTNTVQLTIDFVTLARGNDSTEETARAWRRMRMTFPAIAGFLVGCALGGLLEVHFGLWALAFPVVLAVLAVPLSEYISRTVPATRTQSAYTLDTFVQ